MRRPLLPTVVAALCLLATPAAAVPLGDSDMSLVYRVQHSRMSPLSLNDLTAQDVAFFDQRLRMDAITGLSATGKGGPVRIILQADILDGVLFGDNGSFVGTPRRNRGSFIAARSPNLARTRIGLIDPNGSTLDRDNYGLVLEEAEPIRFNHIYGEASLPFGLLRAGRQPLSGGRSTLVHSGEALNRWGVSKAHDSADGITFATKLSAIADAIAGRPIDKRKDGGLFLGMLFGQVVEQTPQDNSDLFQLASTLFYQEHNRVVLGRKLERLWLSFVHSYRFDEVFDTDVHSLNAGVEFQGRYIRFVFHHTRMFGQSREVAEALALLGRAGDPDATQKLNSFGGLGEIALRLGSVELSFELFYASGDDDPGVDSPITQLTQAEDNNVGLHLFENVLAYQTARSAALGVEALKPLGASTYPVNAISTRGAIQNTIAYFPQVLVTATSWLSLRAGVLFAFTHKPSVDQIGTTLNSDGATNEDDLVNFAGGEPGDYWGTEYDLGLTLSPVDGFSLDLEAAYLQPGNALEDEHGDAVDSTFTGVRLTYRTQ
jgi:hypothetical protein